jgi:hypothetical protein
MPFPVVIMPDAEADTISLLKTALAARPEPYASGVVVSTRNPNPVPPRYARVRRVGGIVEHHVYDKPRLDVLVWAKTDEERMDLANLIHALLLANDARSFLAPVQMPDPIDSTRTVAMLTVERTLTGTQA